VRGHELDANTVTVELPPRRRFRRVARMLAAACCAAEGLPVERTSDVRWLVDEVFHAMSSISRGSIRIILTPTEGHVAVAIVTAPRPGSDWDTVELPILEAVAAVTVSDAVFDGDEELVRFSAVVRERPATP
jgi:hypothetical protein